MVGRHAWMRNPKFFQNSSNRRFITLNFFSVPSMATVLSLTRLGNVNTWHVNSHTLTGHHVTVIGHLANNCTECSKQQIKKVTSKIHFKVKNIRMYNTQLLARGVEQQLNFVLFILVLGHILVCIVLCSIKHNSQLGNKVEPSTYIQSMCCSCCSSKIPVSTLPLVKLKKFARNTTVGIHALTKVSITAHSDIWW
jgi:hypothetical protein